MTTHGSTHRAELDALSQPGDLTYQPPPTPDTAPTFPPEGTVIPILDRTGRRVGQAVVGRVIHHRGPVGILAYTDTP